MTEEAVAFEGEPPGAPSVRGILHQPDETPEGGVVLAHGAGSNCRAPLLAALARELAGAGWAVLRCDLPFRQLRQNGPPPAGSAARDREGLRQAALRMQSLADGRVFLGGHSYGGRQASMLAAEDPGVSEGLLLLSYPLHPPERPQDLRTGHFPRLRTPSLFVHGTRDPFGSPEELREAVARIPASSRLELIEGAGHELGAAAAGTAASAFLGFAAEDEPVRIPVTDVFDLHTVPPKEAKAVLEAYLEEAYRTGFKALRIIHGRGIGVQREVVRAVLARTSFVAAFRDAPSEAGGWGATIVDLH
jgi:predicted alpha/beta-hydrolase family hydrolase